MVAKKSHLSLLLLVFAAVAVIVTKSNVEPNDKNAISKKTTSVPFSEFSIQGIRIGMHRKEVESLLGFGDFVSGSNVGYGPEWTETNPFEVKRRKLSLTYDDDEIVRTLTGQILEHKGLSIKPVGSDYVLGEFGPSDGVAVAAREGDYDHAVMLRYPEAGVHVEYYNENRMWFTVLTPYKK